MKAVSRIKRLDFGIAGAFIIASQIGTSLQSSKSISLEISKVKEELERSVTDREQYFVRKTDVASIISKIEDMNDQLIRLNEQVTSLKSYVKENYAYFEGEELDGLVECSISDSQGVETI